MSAETQINIDKDMSVNDSENREIQDEDSLQRALYARLQLTLKMLNVLGQEKLSAPTYFEPLQYEALRIQQLLKQKPKLSTESLENLLEHCKLFIKKYL